MRYNKLILPKLNNKKNKPALDNYNHLYYNARPYAQLDNQEIQAKEKGWNKYGNKYREIYKKREELKTKVVDYKKNLKELRIKKRSIVEKKPYKDEEYEKFREINKKNLENYNKNLVAQQKEELTELYNFYNKAAQRNKIKLPMISDRLNMRQKPDYAEEHKHEYEQALLFVDKKQSKENCEDFNYDIKNMKDINYDRKNVEDFNHYIRIKNANYKYLKKMKSNKKKCWQIEYEKQNRQFKQDKEFLSKLEERDIDNYLDSM